jgi:preprotein translocase subunit YajC
MPSRTSVRVDPLEGHLVGGAAELIWLALLAAAFWLLLIRPQRRRQQQVMATQRGVEVGDEVMTNAGFFGRVTAEVDDPAAGDCLLLELAPGTVVKVARGAVLRVVTDPVEDLDPTDAPGPIDPIDPSDPTDDNHRSN